jgi:hypothetical protein
MRGDQVRSSKKTTSNEFDPVARADPSCPIKTFAALPADEGKTDRTDVRRSPPQTPLGGCNKHATRRQSTKRTKKNRGDPSQQDRPFVGECLPAGAKRTTESERAVQQ